jgi:hypothetical protein
MSSERIIHVEKKALLETLRANLHQHKETYTKALEGWEVQMKEALESQLERLSQTGDIDMAILRRLSRPESHAQEYNTAIGMLEMDVRSVVELSETEYRQLIEDEWYWKEEWRLSNTRYIKAIKK